MLSAYQKLGLVLAILLIAGAVTVVAWQISSYYLFNIIPSPTTGLPAACYVPGSTTQTLGCSETDGGLSPDVPDGNFKGSFIDPATGVPYCGNFPETCIPPTSGNQSFQVAEGVCGPNVGSSFGGPYPGLGSVVFINCTAGKACLTFNSGFGGAACSTGHDLVNNGWVALTIVSPTQLTADFQVDNVGIATSNSALMHWNIYPGPGAPPGCQVYSTTSVIPPMAGGTTYMATSPPFNYCNPGNMILQAYFVETGETNTQNDSSVLNPF